jgi:branched-chain amino acid transport system permease protein
MSSGFLLQSLLNGILMGGIYSLSAVGLTLIFGVMRVINFAHGSLMMLGMYTTYWAFFLLGIDPYISVLIVLPALFVVGASLQRFLINPIITAPEHNQLLLTLGVSLVLENIAVFVWSPDYRILRTSYSRMNFYLDDISISFVRVLSFAVALALTSAMYLIMTRSDIGKAIRAASEEPEGAALVGINVRSIYWISFGIGAACAGLSGAVIAPFYPTYPYVGGLFVITAFVVVVLGGMGNFMGAFVGGLVIGVCDSLGAVFFPAAMKSVVSFAIFVVILLAKPTGLFGTSHD